MQEGQFEIGVILIALNQTSSASREQTRSIRQLVHYALTQGMLVDEPEIFRYDTCALVDVSSYEETSCNTIVLTQERGVLLTLRTTTELLHDTLNSDAALSMLTARITWAAQFNNHHLLPLPFGNRVLFPLSGSNQKPTHWLALHHVDEFVYQPRQVTVQFHNALSIQLPIRSQQIQQAMADAIESAQQQLAALRQIEEDMAISEQPTGAWFRHVKSQCPTTQALNRGEITRQQVARRLLNFGYQYLNGCLEMGTMKPTPAMIQETRAANNRLIRRARRLK